MKAAKAKIIVKLRIIIQIFFVLFFFYLLISAGNAKDISSKFPAFFFLIDPIILLFNFIATLKITPILLFALIPVALSFIFGRFFCGWVCPFGTINHFFSWIFFKKKRKSRELISRSPRKKLLNLKYLLLIVLLFSAIMNSHLIGWLDPFSLFTRTSAAIITPSVNYSIGYSLKEGAKDEGLIPVIIKPAYKFARKNVLKDRQRYSSQAMILGLILFLILLANLYQHRFFCNYLCPLGALYGLIAKLGLHKLKVTRGCDACNQCSNNCTYNGSPFKDYSKSECMVCYNCVEDCPNDSINTNFVNPSVKKNRTALNLGRRKVTGAIISGLFLGTFPKLASVSNSKIRRFTRPPGSIDEKEFLERCIRCGQCIQVCPTNFIQPALFQSGLEGLWTPILNCQTGYCDFECNKCTQICPTSAIEKLTLEEKKKFKIGTAVIDKNRCYTYADGYDCAVCEEHCPVAEKAIKYRKVKLWNFEGKFVEVKQIYVVFDLCIGCGICENVCPRTDAPGIILTSEEEGRRMGF